MNTHGSGAGNPARIGFLARRPSRSCHGQTLVEFGLVLPMVLLLLLGVVDFGRGVSAYVSLAHAAREAARSGIYPTATDADIRNTVRSQGLMLGSLGDGSISISPEYPRNSGDNLQVVITYDFSAATPLLSSLWGGTPLRMTGAASMRVE